jgi:uncharacterized SAM-binding protein YcdF (DUF218 family)
VLRSVPFVGLLVVLVWLIAGYELIVNPSTDRPHRVDAIVVLGPVDKAGALSLAVQLAQSGYAPTLLLSSPKSTYDRALCTKGLPGAGTAVAVRCFTPHPGTTRGEAQYVGALARQERWTAVMVVTGRYHVARSRLLFDRCVTGRVYAISADQEISHLTWTKKFLYESGAWVKAVANPNC